MTLCWLRVVRVGGFFGRPVLAAILLSTIIVFVVFALLLLFAVIPFARFSLARGGTVLLLLVTPPQLYDLGIIPGLNSCDAGLAFFLDKCDLELEINEVLFRGPISLFLTVQNPDLF